MSKINLSLLDGDTRYMENFASYVTGNYRHRFNLSTFTSAEELINYARRNDAAIDILLIAAEECGEWVAKLDSGLIILLSGAAPAGGAHRENIEKSDNAHRGGDAASPGAQDGKDGFYARDFTRVDRYSGADKLISDILRIYAKNDNITVDAEASRGGRGNRIIAVMSAEGGSGRTSAAVALCAHYARLKLRTLYVSFDYTGAGDIVFKSDKDGGLSEIIYTMKSRPEKLGYKLEALAKIAPGNGFYYISPPLYPMDIDEIQPADIESLISRIRGAGIYDRVVIDANNGLSLRNKILMELADGIFIIARSGDAGKAKLLTLKTQIDKAFDGQADDAYKRCHILLNRVGRNNGAFSEAQCGDAAGTASGPVLRCFNGGDDISSGEAEAIAGIFSAKVSILPYSPQICDIYAPEAIASISNGFGAALAEIARKN
jgi:cellulose biosynthesis protein BcsQ